MPGDRLAGKIVILPEQLWELLCEKLRAACPEMKGGPKGSFRSWKSLEADWKNKRKDKFPDAGTFNGFLKENKNRSEEFIEGLCQVLLDESYKTWIERNEAGESGVGGKNLPLGDERHAETLRMGEGLLQLSNSDDEKYIIAKQDFDNACRGKNFTHAFQIADKVFGINPQLQEIGSVNLNLDHLEPQKYSRFLELLQNVALNDVNQVFAYTCSIVRCAQSLFEFSLSSYRSVIKLCEKAIEIVESICEIQFLERDQVIFEARIWKGSAIRALGSLASQRIVKWLEMKKDNIRNKRQNANISTEVLDEKLILEAQNNFRDSLKDHEFAEKMPFEKSVSDLLAAKIMQGLDHEAISSFYFLLAKAFLFLGEEAEARSYELKGAKEFQESLEYFESVCKHLGSNETYRWYSAAKNAIARQRLRFGQYSIEKAALEHSQAYEVADKNTITWELVIILENQSQTYIPLRRDSEAINCSERSLKLNKEIGYDDYSIFIRLELANLYHRIQQYEKAINMFNELLDVAKKREESDPAFFAELSLRCLQGLDKAYVEQKNYEEAYYCRIQLESFKQDADTEERVNALSKYHVWW
jgi:tetratricopeptide (TPR) repeat protein